MSRVKIFDSGLNWIDRLDSRHVALVTEAVSVVNCCQEGHHHIYAPITLSGHCTLRFFFLHGLSGVA